LTGESVRVRSAYVDMSAVMQIAMTAVMLTTGRANYPSCAPSIGVLPITVYNRSRMSGTELDAIVATADRLWRPYGVTISAGAPHGVAVIVGAEPPAAVSQSAAGPIVLGTTLFSDGHATPYIHLWVGAAEALITASDGDGRRYSALTSVERDAALLPVLGVALAHEIGHYLLDTPHHSRVGLLQTTLRFHDMRVPSPEHLPLTDQQQRVLCAKDFAGLGLRQ